jgi:hypothetical protein
MAQLSSQLFTLSEGEAVRAQLADLLTADHCFITAMAVQAVATCARATKDQPNSFHYQNIDKEK